MTALRHLDAEFAALPDRLRARRIIAEISCGPILLIAELDLHVLAHLALDRLDGPVGRQHPLIAGRLADQQPAVLGQADEGRQDRVAVFLEYMRLAVADDGHFAVGGAQVDADDRFSHDGFVSFSTFIRFGAYQPEA